MDAGADEGALVMAFDLDLNFHCPFKASKKPKS